MIEKIPCKECNAMILPSTAEKTGGLCMPCKQGIRKSIEESKEYYKKQKEYDPYRELWSSLVDRVYSCDNGFEKLTKEEKIYYSVGVLDGEVYNGGMHQFFSNSSGELYSEVVTGLTILKANKSLWLLKRAAKILFGNIKPPRDRMQRWESMKQYPEDRNTPTPEWNIELDKIDDQYYEDVDNINDLLSNYAEENALLQPFIKNENKKQT